MSVEDVTSCGDPYRVALTENEQNALDVYRAQWGIQRAYNLQQNPEKRPIVSSLGSQTVKVPTMYCIIHNAGLAWYQDRFMTPSEMALLQGLDTRPPRPELPVSTPLAIHRAARSRTAMAGQVGNSMNTCVVGSMLLLGIIRTAGCLSGCWN